MADVRLLLTLDVVDDAKKTINSLRASLNSLGQSKGLKNTTAQFAALEKQTKNQSKIFSGLTSQILALGGAYLGLNAIKQAVSDFADFEQAAIEVTTILPATQANLDNVKDSIIDLSNAFGKSKVEEAKALYQTISAGFADASDAVILLKTANELAIGGIASVDTSIRGLTSILNSYSLEAEDASKVSDVLFSTVQYGVTTIPELAQNLGVVTPIAAKLGVSIEELTAAVGALTLSGTQTNTAVVQLRQILAAVLKPTKEAADEADRLGLQFNAAALEAKGFRQFILDVNKAVGNNADSVTKLFGNVRALSGIINLASNNAEDFKNILEKNLNALGKTADASNKVKESLQFNLDTLAQSFKNFGTTLVDFATPAIKSIAKELTIFFRIITGEIKASIDGSKELESLQDRLNAKRKEATRLQEDIAGLQAITEPKLISFANEQLKLRTQDLTATQKQIIQIEERIKNIKAEKKAIDKRNNSIKNGKKEVEEFNEAAKKSVDAAEALLFGVRFSKIQASISSFLKSIRVSFTNIPKDQGFINALKNSAKSFTDSLKAGLRDFGTFLSGKEGAKFLQGAVSAISAGGGAVKSVATSALIQSGDPTAQAVGAIIEIFAKSRDDFEKWANDFSATLINLPTQIATNIPIFIKSFVQATPDLIKSIVGFLPLLLKEFEYLLQDQEFLNAIGESLAVALTQSFIFTFTNPILVKILALRIAKAFILAIPTIVNSFISSLQVEIQGIFDGFNNGVAWFVDAIAWFRDILSKFSLGGISQGAGDFLGSIGGFLGFADGGLVPAAAGQAMPIMAHGGENVIDRTTNIRLERMLSAFESGEFNSPQTIVVKSVIAEKELAEAIFTVKQRGYRVS